MSKISAGEKTSAKMSTQSSNCAGVLMRFEVPLEGSKGHVISIPMSGDAPSGFAPGPGPGPGLSPASDRSPSGAAVAIRTVALGRSVAQPASATSPA